MAPWIIIKASKRYSISTMVGLYVILLNTLLWHTTSGDLIKDETLARQWLNEKYDAMAQKVYFDYATANWEYNTNLTDYNSDRAVASSIAEARFRQEAYTNASKYDWKNFEDRDLYRLFHKVSDIGPSVLTGDDLQRYNQLGSELEKIYSTAEVCNDTVCLSLEPDITRIQTTSRNWDELVFVWDGWRNQTGPKMKDKYVEFVELQNRAARTNGYADAGDYWRSWYETDTFEADCLQLWEEVKPLYQQLHAYVKRKLKEKYADHAKDFPDSGHIPAHILGNMWAQQWSNVMDIVNPFPDYQPIDVTAALKDNNYNATDLFRLAEEFFTSLGLIPMPLNFWKNSMIVKPADRDVVCHASAWDFYNAKDVRIKQCTDITQKWLVTTHHEMGHVQYYLQYKNQSRMFRRGANPGFHEAVGDVLALSVATPEHLHEIGLLPEVENDDKFDINFLMSQALDKIAFLPFGYLIDQWRWSVLRGETTPETYNDKWWELRCKHQGISPPVARAADDFDPAAKYHIPSNTPYIRYFVSYIIQFQFHKALCDAAGQTGPLHRCDIYRSKEAGAKLGNMLAMGSSKPWPDAMEAITGQRQMSAAALVEYFQPLLDWLKQQNEGHDVTWDDTCTTFSSRAANSKNGGQLTIFMIAVSAVSIVLTQFRS